MIDAHQHYWDITISFPLQSHTWFLGALSYPWRQAGLPALERSFLPTDLENARRACEVEETVLINVLHSPAETSWMLDLAARTESVAGVVGWLDLTRPTELIKAELDDLRRSGSFVGVRHLAQFEHDEAWLVREDVLRGLGVLAREEIPYDLLVTSRELGLVPKLAERIPDLQLVLDHAAKPPVKSGQLEPWATLVRRAAENPRLYCKLSGLVTEADHEHWRKDDLLPFVEVIVDAFGVERLMFGSDWPVCEPAASYQEVCDAATSLLESALGSLGTSDFDRVFTGNARSFYRLG